MVKSIILILKFIKKTFKKIYNVSVKCSSNAVNPAPPGKRGVTSALLIIALTRSTRSLMLLETITREKSWVSGRHVDVV